MNKIFLKDEFNKFWSKIENKENFTLFRGGDGERSIMLGEHVVAQEGWKSPDYVSKLGISLLNSLTLDYKNIYYGISCPCCDSPAYYWYSTRIKNKNTTFANLWVNANYQNFIAKFGTLKRDAILIANYRAKDKKIGNLNILKHYEIDDDCINFWENNAPAMIEQIKKDFGDKNDLLYVLSAGPMSSPIIVELYKNNPNNCYIDFGSAIDIYYRKNISRPYMIENNIYAKRNCWMYNPYSTNFDVSVVLNLYKRPQNLELQLDALDKQTLKPKEVLLYQDGTGDTVKIPENIKDRFNLIEISEENKGVWARFDFAKRIVQNEYVCVFDDDTICGSRWLENCHSNMMEEEGLYGTIGILLTEQIKSNYPYRGFFRVGWDGFIEDRTQVDFVGHSWFFKKSWLEYLFEAPQVIKQYKLVGEDMAFSYQLQKKDIKTFVPPHPKSNLDLFGSMPLLALELGTSKEAVSYATGASGDMNEAINFLLNNGWKTRGNEDCISVLYTKLSAGQLVIRESVYPYIYKNWLPTMFGIFNNEERLYVVLFFIKMTLKIDKDSIKKIYQFIPTAKLKNKFLLKFLR